VCLYRLVRAVGLIVATLRCFSVFLTEKLSVYGCIDFVDLGCFFSFLYTVCRTSWTGDQPIARPLPTHRTTQTQKKTHTDIHTSSVIRTHDPSVRAGEDSSCLRSRGQCERSLRTVLITGLHIYGNNISPSSLSVTEYTHPLHKEEGLWCAALYAYFDSISAHQLAIQLVHFSCVSRLISLPPSLYQMSIL
jgi:hypothetical protein